MNLFKKLELNKEIKEQIKIANNAQLEVCVTMDKLLKLIHNISSNYKDLPNSMKATYEANNSLNIIDYIKTFKHCFSTYKRKIETLNTLKTEASKKKLKIKDPKFVIDSINSSFIEIYSKFLVKIQFAPENKNLIKEQFISVIKDLEIPLHTNKNEDVNKI